MGHKAREAAGMCLCIRCRKSSVNKPESWTINALVKVSTFLRNQHYRTPEITKFLDSDSDVQGVQLTRNLSEVLPFEFFDTPHKYYILYIHTQNTCLSGQRSSIHKKI